MLFSSAVEALIAAAEKKNVITGINFCYRYYPAVQEAASRIRSGAIGAIRTATGNFFQDWLFKETDYSWRLEKKYSGISNAVGDIGSHWVDLLRFMTGEKITRVCADTRTQIPVRKEGNTATSTFSSTEENASSVDRKVELEDYGAVLFRMSGGGAGVFSVNQLCAGKKVELGILLSGDRASLEWNHSNPSSFKMGFRDREQIQFSENALQQNASTAVFAGLPAGHPMGYNDAIYNLFNEFYHQIRTGRVFHLGAPSFKDGLYAMKIIEAVIRSSEGLCWQNITEL